MNDVLYIDPLDPVFLPIQRSITRYGYAIFVLMFGYLTNRSLIGGTGGTQPKRNCLRGTSSPDICSCELTVRNLVEKTRSVGALLVRSPPMSGKNSLSQLLEQYLL